QELLDKLKSLGVKVQTSTSIVPKEAIDLLKKGPKKTKPATKEKPKSKPKLKVAAKKPIVKEKKEKPVLKVKAVKKEVKVKETPSVAIVKEPSATPPPAVKPAPIKEIKPVPAKVLKPAVIKERKPFIKEARPVPAKEITPPAAEIKPPSREIEINIPITVKDLSVKLGEKPNVIISKLIKMGIMTTINQPLDEATVTKIAPNLNFAFRKTLTEEEKLISEHEMVEDKALLSWRQPVVTFMGHVDHGKTSLLDTIRKTKVAEKEHGGITQHIGAYEVKINKGKITFLDTPGHEAFTAMRARGANITDIVVLVVAADEGVMPQTVEALDHAKAAGVPIIVALNKIDRQQADVDSVKKQLAELNLLAEDWGGKTVVAGVSAKTGQGIDNLLEMILLEAELLELKANYNKRASGVVVEAQLTKDKGPIATLIVKNGVLKKSDIVIAGTHYGKIKALLNDKEQPIEQANPGMPVEILGLSGVPEAGEQFLVTEDEKKAKEICAKRQEIQKQKQMQPIQRISLEDLYAQVKEGKVKELSIIIKTDVQGSLEALKDSLEELSTKEVKLVTIHTGIGSINNSDVVLAAASNAVIIGFHVEIESQAKEMAEKEGVDVRTYRIIYDATNDIKAALEGLLEPKIKKKFMGRIEIRQVFKLSSRSGNVAGCFVQKGRVVRNAVAELLRNGQVIYEGQLSSLKRFKDDVREVEEGFECGLTLSNFDDYKQGDIVQVYEIEKIARKLKEEA
ncbi:MAG: translation initiation factor IF-2, partial [Candidatus Omnitrophica bacterium]|nr:translation initiation factor IF-2 [Candidatus Omnitrophota bacterium]